MIDPNRSEVPSWRRPSAILRAGERAPDFSLHATPDQAVALEELRGRPVIVAFYPADWSPVCGDQMALYNEVLPEFRRHGGTVVRHLRGRGMVSRRFCR